jgi:pilus assembly protein CpaE
MTAILEFDPLTASGLHDAAGDSATVFDSLDALVVRAGQVSAHGTVVLGPSVETDLALDFASSMRRSDPTAGVVLVRRRMDAALLTAALRAGVREVVAERDLPGLAEAVARSEALTRALRTGGTPDLDGEERPAQGRTVAVWSPKGGCGKTTLAVNMAVDLAEQGHRVLLVDLDLAFGDVAISLGLRPNHGFDEVATIGERIDRSALRGLLTTHESGAMVLAPPNDPGIAERVPAGLVTRLLELARAEFDYVLVDTAPTLDERNITVLEHVDAVLLLTTLDIPSLKNLRVGIDTLRLINYPMDRLHVVLNRADAKVGLSSSEVQGTLGVPVATNIPSSRDVPASTNRGVAIVADNPKHVVSAAVRSLVDDVVLADSHVRSGGPVRGGLLKKWRAA